MVDNTKALSGLVIAIFGATGGVGSAVARVACARGAKVYVSARSAEKLSNLLADLNPMSASVEGSVVDAGNDEEVAAWLDTIVDAEGRIDGVFNAMGAKPEEYRYPSKSTDQSINDFLVPIQKMVGSQFITTRQAAQRMSTGGSIVLISATLALMTATHMAGITAAYGAIESITRALAGDFAGAGVRINCVRADAMPETRTIRETGAGLANIGAEPKINVPLLGRFISADETAEMVLFLIGPGASGMTGQVVMVSAGAFV